MDSLNERYRFYVYPKQELPFPERVLVCPNCKEHLARADIEAFMTCPYCEYKFDPGVPMDEFLLEPMVSKWASSQPGYAFQSLDPFSDL